MADNAPVLGCSGCAGTAGRMACPYHGPQASSLRALLPEPGLGVIRQDIVMPVVWFQWTSGDYEHALNLACVVQWLYCPGPAEHAFAWVSGQTDHLSFYNEQARAFRDVMRVFMATEVRL